MLLRFHEINAFTRKGSDAIGNPAMICRVADFPSEAIMGRAAKMLGSPMTSFIRESGTAGVYEIRHFSPDGVENHVCGHASMAAAEYLARVKPHYRAGADITFALNPKYAINADNAFRVHIKGDDITLTMPAILEMERVDDPEFYKRLAGALRVAEGDIVKPAYYAPRIINYVVAFKDEGTLKSLRPDFNRLAGLAKSKEFPHEGIMATAKSAKGDFDIVTRVFLPVIGVDEDVACGSSMCSVVPYWALIRKEVGMDVRNLFPYPPANGPAGGEQDVSLDVSKGEIKLRGQAAYQRRLLLTVPEPEITGRTPS